MNLDRLAKWYMEVPPRVLGSSLNWAPCLVALSKSHFRSSRGNEQRMNDNR